MSDRYLVHLPDGTEYGPIDRATLAAWHAEGRLPGETLVWLEGAPEWKGVEAVLGSAPAAAQPAAAAPSRAPSPVVASAPASAPASSTVSSPAARRATSPAAAPAAAPPTAPQAPPGAPVRVRDSSSDTKPRARSPFAASRPRRPAIDPATLRKLVWTMVALLAGLAILGGLLAALRPVVARRWAIADLKRYALPERHLEDDHSGLVADLPSGWFALRTDNPFVSVPAARLRLAEPALGAFGTVVAAEQPRHLDDLDAYLDDLVQERLPRRPATEQLGRADVQLGRGQGRLLRTSWHDGSRPMLATLVAWVDGYEILTLEAWAPADAGHDFAVEVEALCRGLRANGQREARLAQAVDRLALDVPELSPDALRLLIADRMSRNQDLAGVPSAALLLVSRGLDALSPAEAEELRVIYQQVWEPVPDTERERMAALLREIRAGREVPATDLQLLREALKAGMLALPPEQRARLQQLSGRAVRRALLRP